jgi:hypothetical protein
VRGEGVAERRMFAKTIIDSDAFLDMPSSARLLYYDLGMRADDDGFCNSPKKIMRISGASDDDLKLLIAKKFIIPFESGVIVIKHWKINNFIRSDRYSETKYKGEKALLELDDNNSYRLTTGIPMCYQLVDERETQVRLGKVSIGKDIKESATSAPVSKFIPPTIEQVQEYCTERNNGIDAESFISFYQSKAWMIGKNKMKDWKSAVITWEKRSKKEQKTPTQNLDTISNWLAKKEAQNARS